MQMARYRALTPEQRVLEALALSEQLYAFTVAGVRARHPAYTDAEVESAVRRLRLGDELFRQVWPQAPLLAL
jgi:hypothetical protein